MEYLHKHLFDIEKLIKRAKRVALFLDFDGTISPIMPLPEQAYLPQKTRQILKEINKICPVAIISGRSLDVIRKKVAIPEIVYAGSHGLEWSIKEDKNLRFVPKSILSALLTIRENLKKLAVAYPELVIEEKPYAVSMHYKFLKSGQAVSFEKDVRRFLNPILGNHLFRIFLEKRSVEIVPQLDWNKGHVVNFIYKHFDSKAKKSLLPIYIGDSKTDEDAFRALRKNGITIRVGKSKKSSAKYYLKNQGEIYGFLKWLSQSG